MDTFLPVVIIPTFNTGPALVRVVRGALEAAHPHPVLVSVDGSTDGSAELLGPLAERSGGRLAILAGAQNLGKGGAVLRAARQARLEGRTHVLTLDADGQHPAALIPEFFLMGAAHPGDFLAGQPVFGPDAPAARVLCRRIANRFAALETPGAGLGDSLFGMRLYPLEPLLEAFSQTRFARGFDFDTEIAVRLVWLGCRPRQIPVPVRYFRPEEGGVSHFRYGRDNLLLAFCHLRLLCERALARRGTKAA